MKSERMKRDFKVVVDRDDSLNYEVRHPVLEALRIPLITILNQLPTRAAKAIFTAFDSKNGNTWRVQRWATTYKALEIMYTFKTREARGETNIPERFWQNLLNNGISLRNRLKLTIREVTKAIKDAAQEREIVHVLSLGSGSSRAIIETLAQLNGQIPIKAKLIDRSRGALRFSQKLAADHGFAFNMEWHRDDVEKLSRYCGDHFCPEVVEMVGLLDYYPKEDSISLMKRIHEMLVNGGWLITCNVIPNLEKPFIAKGIGWPMIYKTPGELREIMMTGGFSAQNVKLICEPLKVHCLSICQKILSA
ncbi:MAG: class I SAM-dependent methyltransferase family protein [Proteobacteria bacterium]|nr:class I SAM-dependent methyltransferase family protein [Pseudomonadota bacterium]